MSMAMPAPSGAQLISSSRDHCRRTGRPGTARASSTASSAASSAPFWPKHAGALHVLDDDALQRTRQGNGKIGAQVEDALRVRPHLERGLAPARHGAGRRHRGVREERPRVAVAHGAGGSCRAWRPRACRRWSSRRGGCAASRQAASRPAARSPRSIARPRAVRATASTAACSVSATTPTKLPSRTTATTPGMRSAAVASSARSLAPGVAGRSTRPYSRPSNARSWMKRGRPNTLSAMSMRGNALPGQLPRRDRLGGRRRGWHRAPAAHRRPAPSSWCAGCPAR